MGGYQFLDPRVEFLVHLEVLDVIQGAFDLIAGLDLILPAAGHFQIDILVIAVLPEPDLIEMVSFALA